MRHYFIVFLGLMLIFSAQSFAQSSTEQPPATSNPDYSPKSTEDGLVQVRWIKIVTKCRPCGDIVAQYNTTMQNLLDTREYIAYLKNLRRDRDYDDSWIEKNKQDRLENDKKAGIKGLDEDADSWAAFHLDLRMRQTEMFNQIPVLEAHAQKLEIIANNLRQQLIECEKQCAPKDRNDLSIGGTSSSTAGTKPALPFDWKGPYPEVCKECRKLANTLNSLPAAANAILVELQPLEARRELVILKIRFLEWRNYYEYNPVVKAEKERALKELKQLRRELKDLDKKIKRLLSDLEKIKKKFEETLPKYNECVKTKCPPRKNACVFPSNQNFASITIGPNDEVGSSAQAAKEMRDRVTGAAKGAATKAIGGLLGIGGLGGGGSSGPKTDRDRTRGDFTRLSSGDTNLDVRASWRNDELIVSTDIADSPDDGTFHAQWLQDKEGNIYLPTRYLIFKMYRDWKLTVSWTEDHYVNGEHVFHDEGQTITTGRDLLGTWTLFEGENAKTNSIWGMLGFDTAAKGVKHLGAVYDIPMEDFPDDCQIQLVTHVSQPSLPMVGTLPIVGNLFKHQDTTRRRPETVILVQPHLVSMAED